MGKNVVLWLVILAVLLTVFSNLNVDSQNPPVKYWDFLRSVEQGQVNEVTIQGNRIYATDRTGSRYTGGITPRILRLACCMVSYLDSS